MKPLKKTKKSTTMTTSIERQIDDLLQYETHIRAHLFSANIDITDYAAIIAVLIELQNHIRRKQYEYERQNKKQ